MNKHLVLLTPFPTGNHQHLFFCSCKYAFSDLCLFIFGFWFGFMVTKTCCLYVQNKHLIDWMIDWLNFITSKNDHLDRSQWTGYAVVKSNSTLAATVKYVVMPKVKIKVDFSGKTCFSISAHMEANYENMQFVEWAAKYVSGTADVTHLHQSNKPCKHKDKYVRVYVTACAPEHLCVLVMTQGWVGLSDRQRERGDIIMKK